MSRLERWRPSSFLLTVTLRSRRSWTRWRRNRMHRRLAREGQRLASLLLLVEHQRERVQQLEGRLHPPPTVELPPSSLTRPRPGPTREVLEARAERAQERLAQLPPEEPEEPLEPMPDPTAELAQRLGLPALPS